MVHRDYSVRPPGSLQQHKSAMVCVVAGCPRLQKSLTCFVPKHLLAADRLVFYTFSNLEGGEEM